MSRLNPKKLTRYRTQPSVKHEVRYNCPHCGDMQGRLWANFKKGLWTCFHCGESGSILPRDMAIIRGETGPAFRSEPVRQFSWQTYTDIRGSGEKYLTDRNVGVQDAYLWGVRSGKGDTASRIVVPVRYRTQEGRKTMFKVAHATTDVVRPKELQSGDRLPLVLSWDNKGKPLYAPYGYTPRLWWGKQFSPRTAIIVEGAADALRLASAARQDPKLRVCTSIVCLWGKHLKEETAFELAGLFDHHYIMLDRETELAKTGEAVAGMKIYNSLAAISDGYVTLHRWTREEGPASDPAELDDGRANHMMHKALRRTGG